MIHTVLVSSDRDRITRWPVTYAGPGQHPNPVLGPFFQFVQHESRVIQSDNLRLRVGASALDDLQLVVHDPPVRSIGRRRFPCYQYGGRADRLSGYIARRSPGDCITLSYRGEKRKRKRGREIVGQRTTVANFGHEHRIERWRDFVAVCGPIRKTPAVCPRQATRARVLHRELKRISACSIRWTRRASKARPRSNLTD